MDTISSANKGEHGVTY